MTHIPALKEWAAICHALLSGEQIIDLRKGGIREDVSSEGRRRFEVTTQEAWLYPTAEHQREELLKEPYRRWINLAPHSLVGQAVTVHGWVEIIETHTISDAAKLEALTSRVIWSHDYAASRLKWKSRDPLWVLVLRAHTLATPITVDWSDDYGGCTSWVDLDGLPNDPRSLDSTPALSDEAFAARLKGVHESLGIV